MTKKQAIKQVMKAYPLLTETAAKYYAEEVLGY